MQFLHFLLFSIGHAIPFSASLMPNIYKIYNTNTRNMRFTQSFGIHCVFVLLCTSNLAKAQADLFSATYDYEHINTNGFTRPTGQNNTERYQYSSLYTCRELAKFAEEGSFGSSTVIGNGGEVRATKLAYTPFEVQVGDQAFQLRMMVVRPNDNQIRPCILLTPGGDAALDLWYTYLHLGVADYVNRGYVVAFYENWNNHGVMAAYAANPGTATNLPVNSDPELPFYALYQFANAAAKYLAHNATTVGADTANLFAGGHSAGGHATYSLAFADAANFSHPVFAALGGKDDKVWPSSVGTSYNIRSLGIQAGGMFPPTAKMGDLLDPSDTATEAILWHGAADGLIGLGCCPTTPCSGDATLPVSVCGAQKSGDRLRCAGIMNEVYVNGPGGHRVIVDQLPLNSSFFNYIESFGFNGPVQGNQLNNYLKMVCELEQYQSMQAVFAAHFKLRLDGGGISQSSMYGRKPYAWPLPFGLGSDWKLVNCPSCISPTPALMLGSESSTGTCAQQSNGSATVAAAGGESPYDYSWSNQQEGASIANLTAGSYGVTVTDNNGCTAFSTVLVEAFPSPSVGLAAQGSCAGAQNGSLTALALSGTAPYTYTWGNGTTGPEVLANLPPGNYTVTISDAHDCTATAMGTVDEIPTPVPFIANSTSTCVGTTNGALEVGVSGGIAPFSYEWNAPGSPTGPIANNLPPGSFPVVVTGQNGCAGTVTGSVAPLPEPLADIVLATGTCPGDSSGALMAHALGDAPPFGYAWSNGQTGQYAAGLQAGSFSVTVTDANGCSDTATAKVPAFPAPAVAITDAVSACFDLATGSLTAAPTGGTPPFDFFWQTSDTLQTASNLPAGQYSVTVTDANACSAIGTGNVNENNEILPVIEPQATGGSFCAAMAAASGGTPPFDFLWSNGETGSQANALPMGAYSVTITDSTGCTANISADCLASTAEEPRLEMAAVYPNPSGGVFFVDNANACMAGIAIYGLDGRQAGFLQSELAPGVLTIELVTPMNGVYMVQLVRCDGSSALTKIVVNAR